MEIGLKVGNTIYKGWEDVRVTKSMQSIAHTFEMSVYNGDNVAVDQNTLVTVLKEGAPFVTGYLDAITLGISETKQPLKIAGRSKAMDLIDCNILDNKQYNNLTPTQIINDLISPFNMSVSTQVSLEPLEVFNTEVGETYFNAINRLCKQVNVLPVSTNSGDIELIKNQDVQVGSPLKDGDFKSLTYDQKFNDRYSEYTYKKETVVKDVQDATVSDEAFSRFRPFVGVNTEDKTNESMAKWKQNSDEANSVALKGSVVGWDLNINTIARIETEVVNASFLIKDITYSKGENGTVSDINFVNKNLYKV